jgi:antitoxin CcdA
VPDPDPIPIDATVAREAPASSLPPVGAAGRLERNRRWREENRAALAAYAREVERDGLPLARFRSF